MNKWKYISAFRQGLSHISKEIECQDYVLIKETEELLIAALSDGLGSLDNSQIASRLAVEKTCEFLLNNPSLGFKNNEEETVSLKEKLITDIVNSIKEEADRLELDIDTMDCTLCFVCVSKKENQAVVGCLGDSAVCVIKKEEPVVINNSDVSANGTHAILDDDAVDYLLVSQLDIDNDDILGFIITSDGLETEIFTKGNPYIIKKAEEYFNFLNSDESTVLLEKKLEQLVDEKGYIFDDDISLAILSRTEDSVVFDDDITWLCKCGHRNEIYETYCSNCSLDFLELYGDLDFREQGGKFAFFKKMNKDPEEEKKIISSENPEEENTGANNSTAQEQETNDTDFTSIKPKEYSCKKQSRLLIVLLCFFCILLAVAVGVKCRNKSINTETQPTEVTQTLPDKDKSEYSLYTEHTTQSESSVKVTENRDSVETVSVNRNDVVLESLTTAKTSAKESDSETTAAKSAPVQLQTKVNIVSESTTFLPVNYGEFVITEDVPLKEKPGMDSKVIGMLSKEETVKMISMHTVFADEKGWIEVETSNGKKGWINENNIKRVDH